MTCFLLIEFGCKVVNLAVPHVVDLEQSRNVITIDTCKSHGSWSTLVTLNCKVTMSIISHMAQDYVVFSRGSSNGGVCQKMTL